MAKVQDTYNPLTGEYVKRISDWTTIDGSYNWSLHATKRVGYKTLVNWLTIANAGPAGSILMTKHDSRVVPNIVNTTIESVYLITKYPILTLPITEFGIPDNVDPTVSEIKAYFHGWKMANADGTSPYYKSEVPYTPATWAEWATWSGTVTRDSTGISLAQSTTVRSSTSIPTASLKSSTKYGILYNVTSNNGFVSYYCTFGTQNASFPSLVGNNKVTYTTTADTAPTYFRISDNNYASADGVAKFKDIRIFELPTGSQIETDFNTLTADQLSAKYTFNGLCIKNWKKVTDGTGLTSTLPTASYAGYTPYKMIYQLATPEISYLTPKASIPLYDTNTIVETNTLADCKADVTVGYKLKSGATAVGGDITAPTPDYMSAVNSVSELGDKKGIVRGKNLLNASLFRNLTLYGVTCTVSNGKIYLNGTATNTSNIQTSPFALKSGIYILSANNPNIAKASNIQVLSAGATEVISADLISVNGKSNGIYMSGTGLYTARIRIESGNVYNNFEISPQLEEGSTATTFEIYKTPVQTTLPTLRKIGTVVDTYNPETGVLVQRIGKKVFDGTENYWSLYPTQAGSTVKTVAFMTNVLNEPMASFNSASMIAINNLFENNIADVLYVTDREMIGTKDAQLRVRVDKNRLTTQDANGLKVFLTQKYANGTPLIVYYQLATPIVTTFTKTALPTYKPTTVIESDSTVKGNVSANYKLKPYATPVAGDFLASPESVNEIKDLGNSIDVVSSVGRRNLIVGSPNFILNGSDNLPNRNKSIIENDYVSTTFSSNGNVYSNGDIRFSKQKEKGKTYTLSFEVNTDAVYGMYFYPSESYVLANFIPNTNNTWQKINYTYTQTGSSTIGSSLFGFYNGIAGKTIKYKNIKLEEGNTATAWTPAPEDFATHTTITNGVYKTNILLGAPLRSVGNVKDRLFKDSDGKWKIERNIGEMILNGTEAWIEGTSYPNTTFYRRYRIPFAFMKTNAIKNVSHFNVIENSIWTEASQHAENDIGYLSFVVSNSLSSTVEIFKNWVTAQYNADTPVVVQYEKAPTYETLSQELQTDLDNIPTFPEHNYVYTVTNDNLQPTLHVDYKKLSWLKSRLLLNSLKIYSRNLTDAEMIQNYKVEKERFGM